MRLFRWSLIALAGAIGGMVLGEMAIEPNRGGTIAEPATYSHLSANPRALPPASDGGAVPCPDCLDSYGVAARLRADREDRMSEPFRALGEVDPDPAPPDDTGDAYRFGGRFPDPDPEPPAMARSKEMKPEPFSDIPFDEDGKPPTGEY